MHLISSPDATLSFPTTWLCYKFMKKSSTSKKVHEAYSCKLQNIISHYFWIFEVCQKENIPACQGGLLFIWVTVNLLILYWLPGLIDLQDWSSFEVANLWFDNQIYEEVKERRHRNVDHQKVTSIKFLTHHSQKTINYYYHIRFIPQSDKIILISYLLPHPVILSSSHPPTTGNHPNPEPINTWKSKLSLKYQINGNHCQFTSDTKRNTKSYFTSICCWHQN